MDYSSSLLHELKANSRDEAAYQRLLHLLDPLLVDVPSGYESSAPPVRAAVSDAYYSAIVHSSSDAIITKTLTGIMTSWNPAAETLYGYTADEAIGQPITLIVPPERHDEIDRILAEISRGLRIDRQKTVRLRKDGTRVEVALTVSPVKDSFGTIIGASAIGQDITAIRQVQAELLETAKRYQTAIDLMFDGIVIQSTDGSIETCNASAERILGLSRAQMTGMTSIDPHWAAIHEDFQPFPGDQHPAMVALRTGQMVSNVIMGVRKPDGTFTWIVVNAVPLFNEAADRPYAVLTSFTDVTGIKRAHEALEQNELRLRSIYDTMEDGVWAIDLPSRRISYLNPACQRIYGITTPNYDYDPDLRSKTVHPDDLALVNASYARLFEQGTLETEYRIVRPDGTLRWVNVRAWVIYAQSTPIRIEGLMSDITDRKLAQQQTLELQLERERSRLLSDFITNTSHELRTPMTVIGLDLYLIGRTNNRDLQQSKIAEAQQQINKLNHILSQLQDMVKLDRFTALELTPIDPRELVRAVIDAVTTTSEGITLTIDLAPDLPLIAAHDSYFQRSLKQLIDNAIRFVGADRQVIVRGHADPAGDVIFEVEDHGPGIEPAHLDHIFEQFYKVDEARTDDTSGVGLGLAMVRRVMQLHQGSASVSSQPGERTIFSLRLPAIKP